MRDESVGKGINLLGVIIGGIAIVSFILLIVYFVIDKGSDAKSKMGKQADDALNYEYTQYDGEVVTGAEVLTAITRFKSDTLYICVNNGLTTTYYNLDTNFQPAEKVATAKNKGDLNHYINPSSKFTGEVNYDNDVIVGITFTKQ